MVDGLEWGIDGFAAPSGQRADPTDWSRCPRDA